MPITQQNRNQVFANGSLVSEDVVQVDVTAEHTQAAIVQAFADLRDELAANRAAYVAALAAVQTARDDVVVHVSNIESIRDSTGTLTNAQRDGALRQLADAMRDHFTASNRLADSTVVLAQATDTMRLAVHRLGKLVLVLLDQSQRDSVLADDPDDPLVVE